MLSIAIDSFRLIAEQRTSGVIYLTDLLESLSELSDIDKLYLLVPRKPANDSAHTGLLRSKKVEMIYPNSSFFPEQGFWSQFFWIQIEIPRLIKRMGSPVDYYLAPYHQPPILLPKRIRIITVIHDLCGLEYPKTKKGFYEHLLMLMVASIRSNRFVPISEYTRTRFIKRFPYVFSRTGKAVYPIVHPQAVREHEVMEIVQRYGLSGRPYFMGFGAPSPGQRKGMDLILDSFRIYKERGGRAALLLVVTRAAHKAVEHLIRKASLHDIMLVSDLESIERDALYKGALALLFPSRCEGFGYPIVEAMCQGCPPIAWNKGPAGEIVPHSVPLMTTLRTENIVDLMSRYEGLSVIDRSKLSEQLIKRSLRFVKYNYGQTFFDQIGHLKE